MRCFSWSTLSTTARTLSPFLSTSLGWPIFFVHDRSGDVQQPVDALFDLDEGVVGDVADLALDHGARRVLLGHALPGVLLDLLHPEGDLLLSLLISRTFTSTFCAVTTSDGWLIRLVQDISEMCTSPSTPSSSFTKRRRT